MPSLLRRLQRNAIGADPKPRVHQNLPCGGYRVLHPTRGWKRYSMNRLMGQAHLAEALKA